MLSFVHAAKSVTYIWNFHELDSIRQHPSSQAFRNLVQKADQMLAAGVVAVTDKPDTRSGDKHNYESLSIYWWPDSQNPDGPYLARDGHVNPEYQQYDYPRLQQLLRNLTNASQAFYLTQEQKYYDYVCRQLDTWFINDATRMTPNFEYSQFIPGRNEGRGNPQGMIDAYTFNSILESIRLTDSVQPLGKKRIKALRKWFKTFAQWMQKSDYGQKASRFKNNQAVAYDVTLYNIYLFLDSKSKRKGILNSFYDKRVQPQIDEEGKMPEELKRTKAYSYSIYNLTHLIDFCLMVDNDVLPLPPAILEKVQKSHAYLQQFADAPQRFPYKELDSWQTQTNNLQRESRRLSTLQAK